ncbi:hypothetical protein BB560_000365 [Smittium megazygosporum]|uniref:Adenylyl cyclase-associated protein n=1 Tax=Smittium megazygosporum TaxID=133381 RepID=A0A2T9ZKK7_9FUNG|nr:hypothetical protein BB560_000365 [Smittium megazygosporum]
MDPSARESFSKLISRLENATSKLEKLSSSRDISPLPASDQQATPVAASISISEIGSSAKPISESPVLSSYKSALLSTALKFLELSKPLGTPVVDQCEVLVKLLKKQAQFVDVASRLEPPSAVELQKLLTPQIELLGEISEIRNKNRAHQYSNELTAVSEGSNAFGWITVEKTPLSFIGDMKDSAQFYVNRVLKDSKDSEPHRAESMNLFKSLIDSLSLYVKQNHLTGLRWGYQKPLISLESALSILSQEEASLPTTEGNNHGPSLDSNKSDGDKAAALFKEINQGTDIIKTLKKVDKEKSAAELSSKPIPTPQVHSEKSSKGSASKSLQRKPRKELDGKRWIVENIHDDEIHIPISDINQTLYVFNCNNSTIIVENKLNTITFNSCTRCNLVFDSLVSSCDILKCKSVKIQVNNTAPFFNLDNTDGAQIFLSKESMEAVEILTTKSSEVNICYPGKDNEDNQDLEESPLPEQMITKFVGGTLVTLVRKEF